MKEGFEIHHKEKKENQKVELLQVIRRLVSTYYTQVLKLLEGDQISKLEKSRKACTFMPQLADWLVKYLTDYFDSVREQAQNLVSDIVCLFIPYNEQFSAA